MTDLDPEIWENETLGAASQNENLERLEKQQHENRQAMVEDREPRDVVIENTYPGWTPEVNPKTGTVPSNYQSSHFADETQADIPTESGPYDETAGGLAETDSDMVVEAPEEEGSSSETDTEVKQDGESESTDTDSTEEDGSTQWT